MKGEAKGRLARVLHVEDDKAWRILVRNILEEAGFQCSSAGSIEEAWRLLDEGFYHVAVLDMKLRDEGEDRPGGLEILKQLDERGLGDSMSVIICSGYCNKEMTREAFQKYGVADVLQKQEFDEDGFVKLLERLLAEDLRVNLALRVVWEHEGGPGAVVRGLRLDAGRVGRDTPLEALAAEELEDLLCRLFRDCESLSVRHLPSKPHGTALLHATPFYESGPARPAIVRFGDAREIDDEYKNFKQYVEPYSTGGRHVRVHGHRRARMLGGIAYSFLGACGESLETFSAFYERADVVRIKEALDEVFLGACGQWYVSHGNALLLDLADEYRRFLDISPGRLAAALADKLGVTEDDPLRPDSLGGGREFINPLPAAAMRFESPAYSCVTHGLLTGDNIVVDGAGHAWLTDFSRTGRGHALRDVARLDSFVRFRLLADGEATLGERVRLEEALCSTDCFGGKGTPPTVASENAAVAKAYVVSAHLRALACRLVPGVSVREYYVPLLFCALDAARDHAAPEVNA